MEKSTCLNPDCNNQYLAICDSHYFCLICCMSVCGDCRDYLIESRKINDYICPDCYRKFGNNKIKSLFRVNEKKM